MGQFNRQQFNRCRTGLCVPRFIFRAWYHARMDNRRYTGRCNVRYQGKGAGDVNADGYSDVIISAGLYINGDVYVYERDAFVYKGSASGLLNTAVWTFVNNQPEIGAYTSIAGAGDVNGDGIGDVIVGDPNYSNGEQNEGRALAYLGQPDVVLPLHMLEFTGRLTGNKATLQWITINEAGTSYYEVQRSTDGKNFIPVTKVNSRSVSGSSQYNITDDYPFTGTIYYRLKIAGSDQKFNYSLIVVLRNAKGDFWEIHPSLLSSGQSFNLGINSQEDKKNITLNIIDINGRILQRRKLLLTKGYQIISLTVMGKGFYIIQLAGFKEGAEVKKNLVE